MEELKRRQKELYAAHTARPDSLRLGLDKYGFSLGIRIKEKKLKRIVDSFAMRGGVSVLDIGCRDARLLNKLNAGYGVKGIGLDISLDQLRENIKANPFGNVYCAADAEDLPFKGNIFDFIFCFDVFEHLPHPEKCLSEISRVLKTQGTALIYVINKNDTYTWHWFLRKLSFGAIGLDKGEFGDHDRCRFIKAQDIKVFSRAHGLDVKKIIFFHSFFTLAFDELWPGILHLLHRIISGKGSPGMDGNTGMNRPPLSIRLCSRLADFAAPVLGWLDNPWAARGYSNGFFVIARKGT